MDGLRIDRLPEGGFVVTRIGSEQNMMSVCVFASSRIDQALGFIRGQLDPDKSMAAERDKLDHLRENCEPKGVLGAERQRSCVNYGLPTVVGCDPCGYPDCGCQRSPKPTAVERAEKLYPEFVKEALEKRALLAEKRAEKQAENTGAMDAADAAAREKLKAWKASGSPSLNKWLRENGSIQAEATELPAAASWLKYSA